MSKNNSNNKRIERITVLGDKRVMKSRIIERFINKDFKERIWVKESFVDYSRFENENVFSIDPETGEKQSITINIFNSMPSSRDNTNVSPMPLYLFQDTVGFILAFNMNDKETFNSMHRYIYEINKNMHVVYPIHFVTIIGIDEKGTYYNNVDNPVGIKEVTSFCDERSIPFFNVSVKDNINIQEAFISIINKITQQPQQQSSIPKLEKTNNQFFSHYHSLKNVAISLSIITLTMYILNK